MQDVENDTQVRENASKMLQMKQKVIQGASQETSPTVENLKPWRRSERICYMSGRLIYRHCVTLVNTVFLNIVLFTVVVGFVDIWGSVVCIIADEVTEVWFFSQPYAVLCWGAFWDG